MRCSYACGSPPARLVRSAAGPRRSAVACAATAERSLHLVWFTSSCVRLDDHPALNAAEEAARLSGGRVACVYVTEAAPRPACSPVEAAAVLALRARLQTAGGDLLLHAGPANLALPALCAALFPAGLLEREGGRDDERNSATGASGGC